MSTTRNVDVEILEKPEIPKSPPFDSIHSGKGVHDKASGSTLLAALVTLLVAVSAVAVTSLVMVVELKSEVNELKSSSNDLRISNSAVAPAGYSAISLFDGEWAPGAHMAQERSDFQAVICDGKSFLLGGLDASGSVVDTVIQFDTVLEVYSTLPVRMPQPRYRFGAACLDGKVYVAGGYASSADGDAGSCLATMDVYDVAAGTWAAAPPLTISRGDFALTSAVGQLYAIGGYDTNYATYPALASVEEFNPVSGQWRASASLPSGKGDIAAVEIAGKLYVPGGWNGKFTDELAVFDIATGKWTLGAPMMKARGDKAVVAMHSHVYVIGGEMWSGKTGACPWNPNESCDINGVPMHACEVYNPEQDAWTSFAPIPSPLFRFSAVAADGVVYTFGGQGRGQVAVNDASKFFSFTAPRRLLAL